jgi:hypothetical protein
MIERMSAVSARDRGRRARARLEAIGRAYLEFARTEPGWFRTAFSSARAHGNPGSEPVLDVGPDPNPYDVLGAALDELVDAGALTRRRRAGAEYAAWSAVHGLAGLLLDGPLSSLPEAEAQRAIGSVIAAINRSLA